MLLFLSACSSTVGSNSNTSQPPEQNNDSSADNSATDTGENKLTVDPQKFDPGQIIEKKDPVIKVTPSDQEDATLPLKEVDLQKTGTIKLVQYYIQECHYQTKNLTCGKESPMCTMILTPTDYCGQYVKCSATGAVQKDILYDQCIDCFTCTGSNCPTDDCKAKFPDNPSIQY